MATQDIQFGTYYRDRDGTLVVALYIDTRRVGEEAPREMVWCQRGTEKVGYDVAAFCAAFSPAPDAPARREAEVRDLMQAITADEAALMDVQRQLGALSGPSAGLLGGGDPDAADPDARPTHAIARTGEAGVQAVEGMRKQVALVRNEMQKLQLRMRQKNAELQARVQEQAAVIEARMRGLTKMVEAAQEVIWTFNLYLGRNESIEVLRQGAPCPPTTRITLMQRVLYMDEESALKAEFGGMDALDIPQFTTWLLAEPSRLTTLLPREKGVVALKPRRRQKERAEEDPWTAAQKAVADQHTYFLMRNGENVYLIDTDLELRDVLFPRQDDFARLFERVEYTRNARGAVTAERRVLLTPGSDAYMKAMERAQAEEKHYLRVFLFLQGLLDRTPVFQPYEGEAVRLNVFDLHKQDTILEFFADAEDTRLLSDGRPSFEAWLADVNREMTVGMRVIGHFATHTRFDSRESESRTAPSNVPAPATTEVHTIERRREGGRYRGDDRAFVILYPYARYGWRPDPNEPGYERYVEYTAERRASLWFYPDDDHILCVDRASVADMRYYLESRTNREAYARMFPVLTAAIAFKEREAAEEQPFRDALVGALMREHGLAQADATTLVDELVAWYKFKNTAHRALTADDATASRHILKEAALRLRRRTEAHRFADVLRPHVAETWPNALGCYHVRDNTYLVLVPEDAGTVWVREVELEAGPRIGIRQGAERRWCVVDDLRLARWTALWEAPALTAYERGVDPRARLNGDELAEAMEAGWAALRAQTTPTPQGRHRIVAPDRVRCVIPLTAAVTGRQVEVCALVAHAQIPDAPHLLTGALRHVQYGGVTVRWDRANGTAGTVQFRTGQPHESLASWIEEDLEAFMAGRATRRTYVWADRAAIQQVFDELEAVGAARARRDALHRARVQPLLEQVDAERVHRHRMALLTHYLTEEHGDVELFDTWLREEVAAKRQVERPAYTAEPGRYAAYVIEAGVDPRGWTLGRLLADGHRRLVADPRPAEELRDPADVERRTVAPDWSSLPLDIVLGDEAEDADAVAQDPVTGAS